MLVDNGVNGDSRVQKAARSAADAGWEVVLLGKSPTEVEQTWQLGAATVRLLPMPTPLHKRRHEFRRRWLRAPLAYPPTGIAEHRAQAMRAWRADIDVRAAALGLAQDARQAPPRARAARTLLRLELLVARALGRWVGYRQRRLQAAQRARRGAHGRWDRLYTAFWRAALRDRAWRKLEPGLWDWELAYGPVVDELAPDLIHANDFRMLGVGARATIRARAAGRPVKLVWDAHEFLPGVRPWRSHARWLPANCAHEREYAPWADAVVTVSAELGKLLRQRHGLAEDPAVVLNAPAVAAAGSPAAAAAPSLRELCGVGPETPLLVYSGGVTPPRGVDTMVDALPGLPGVHAAVVAIAPNKGISPQLSKLVERAAEIGVADRVHILPYVPYDQVVPFLSAADVGVIPIHHWPNHELALITKFFEYAQARLPIVVSDVRAMAETVRSTGQGEVFRATDIADFVRAVQAVLADPESYRSAYDKPGLLEAWTWDAQADVLTGVYERLLPGRAAAVPRPRTAPESQGPSPSREVTSGVDETPAQLHVR
jgi:glycosyltransferase involved in cell wall biosynthesis